MPFLATVDPTTHVDRIQAGLERNPVTYVAALALVGLVAALVALLREKDARLADRAAENERAIRHEATADALARVAQYLEAKATDKRRRVSRPETPVVVPVRDSGEGP